MRTAAWLLVALPTIAAVAVPGARADTEATPSRVICQRRWTAHPEMQRDCLKRQIAAKARLAPKIEAARSAGKDSPEGQVMQMCRSRWGQDWARIERCYGSQLQGYWRLYPGPRGVQPAAPAPPSPAPATPTAP